jgi:hypothetical protein
MVVPTYPEGGNLALKVCQHHHQVVRVGHFVGLSETGRTWCSRDCSGRFGRNLHGRTAHTVCAVRPSREGGGRWPASVQHACAVFFRAKSRHGDRFNLPPTPCRVCFRPCVFNKFSLTSGKNPLRPYIKYGVTLQVVFFAHTYGVTPFTLYRSPSA